MHELVWNTPMLVSGIILVLTFIGIFTEAVHGFHRTKFAMGGAGLMILAGQYFGFYNTELAVEAVDWNVVFLLGGMMTIVGIMIPTGGFQYLAYKIADITGGKLFMMMALMGTLVTVLSLLLDNVTTVVIFGPLIILICKSMKVTPVPYLLAAALLSDTGGVATLVGDPPNLMIGSAANIDFNTFLYHMGGLVFAAWIVILFFLKILFKKELAEKPEMPDFSDKEVIKDPRTWKISIYILCGMAVLFVLHGKLHWEPWFVAAIGLTALVFIAHHIELDESFSKAELSLLMFFISLFILVGGVEESQFLEYIGQYIFPFVQADLMTACIILMWGSAVFSAAIDNIPFTAAMIPIIMGMETQGINVTPLWWALAVGVGMGGNGTHLGSTANVFIVTISERLAIETGDKSYRITPGLWFRKGTPVMILTLIVSTAIFLTFFEFYENPLPNSAFAQQ
jgi:Na+/H+ antiporter NhaD/arsenite permease-like protein